MDLDLFEEWLYEKENNRLIKRALTAVSFKNVNHNLSDSDTGFELATYGDALIKFCYASHFLDNCEKLSKEIEKYVTDEGLVRVIAKHYSLLNYINYDKNDELIKSDYEYVDKGKTIGKNKKESPHKYIADVVEAMIGAIYLEIKDIGAITELLDSWRKL